MIFFKNLVTGVSLTFHFFKATLQMVYGAWKISKLPQPIISIFGGSRLKKTSTYLARARQLAQQLVDNNISVLTGGGPGIMEAATCGAAHKTDGQIRTMGIGVKNLKGEEGFNPCVKDSVMVDYFFARKHLLMYYSRAFVVFPGGFGTIDELSELLTLMETGKLPYAPIILIDKEYWANYMAMVARAQREGLTAPEEVELTITDSIDEALKLLVTYCAQWRVKEKSDN